MPEQQNDMQSQKKNMSPNLSGSDKTRTQKNAAGKTGVKDEDDKDSSSCGTGSCDTGSCS